MAQDADRLWTFVSMVMNIEVLCKVECLEYVSDYLYPCTVHFVETFN